jgi:hypothetical protein
MRGASRMTTVGVSVDDWLRSATTVERAVGESAKATGFADIVNAIDH